LKVWTVANQKGGVGKTTTAVTIAGILANRGCNTLMVDLDPHGSLTSYFGLDPDHTDKSIYELFQGAGGEPGLAPEKIVLETRFDHLYLLPASTAMATLDRQLGAQNGKGLVIKSALQKLSQRFTHVLIDCPPNLGILMVNALAACEHLIIPVQTEFLAMKGLERMLHTIGMIVKSRHSQIQYSILPTMFDQRTRASLRTMRQLREKYPDNTFEPPIPIDTLFREASQMGVPLPLISNGDRGVKVYAALVDKLLKQHQQTEEALAVP
jgi:chromosome partitioning protein